MYVRVTEWDLNKSGCNNTFDLIHRVVINTSTKIPGLGSLNVLREDLKWTPGEKII